MSIFQFHGPLSLESPLYKGRATDLEKLIRWCQGEIQHYGILYGARQCGKTSLLLRLDQYLASSAAVCWVDFEYLSDGSPARAFTVLAQKIAETLKMQPPSLDIHDAMSFADNLCQMLSMSSVPKLVLMIEEMGALQKNTRFAIANGLRAIFNDRVRPSRRILSKFMVIIAGNIEVYELASTEVSPIGNICQKHYLDDLEQENAVALIEEGMSTLGVEEGQAKTIAMHIYELTHGYPYLTQRLGNAIEMEFEEYTSLDHDTLERGISKFLLGDNALIKHIRRSLNDQDLEVPSRALILGNVPFDRRDEGMARLELIGLARNDDNTWRVRNQLFQRILEHWLHEQDQQQEPLGMGLVRIFDSHAVPVGAGILVHGNRVVTCGHVVASALDITIDERPEKEIAFDFPLLAPGVKVWASVENWHTYEDGTSNDLITLQVQTDLPKTASPLRLINSSRIKDQEFRVFGFSKGRPDGVWATGVIRSHIADGRVQIEDIKIPGYSIVQGFSGSPVWSEKESGIVGIVVATDKDANTKAGFMIPSKLLQTYIQDLPWNVNDTRGKL